MSSTVIIYLLALAVIQLITLFHMASTLNKIAANQRAFADGLFGNLRLMIEELQVANEAIKKENPDG